MFQPNFFTYFVWQTVATKQREPQRIAFKLNFNPAHNGVIYGKHCIAFITSKLQTNQLLLLQGKYEYKPSMPANGKGQ